MRVCSDFDSVRLFRRYYTSPEVTKCPKPTPRGLSRSDPQKHGRVVGGGAVAGLGAGGKDGGGVEDEEDQEKPKGLFPALQSSHCDVT